MQVDFKVSMQGDQSHMSLKLFREAPSWKPTHWLIVIPWGAQTTVSKACVWGPGMAKTGSLVTQWDPVRPTGVTESVLHRQLPSRAALCEGPGLRSWVRRRGERSTKETAAGDFIHPLAVVCTEAATGPSGGAQTLRFQGQSLSHLWVWAQAGT